jgi:sugar phosphate isomerase/epimerase
MKSSRGSDHAGEIMGCCGSMISPSTDPIGIEIVETMAEIGFDYTELSLSDIAALPEGAFADLARRVERSRIQCEACNNFFPRTIRLTGAEARLHVALDYARHALDRAARLGARIVVFGSSGAKNVPVGFSRGAAWHQIVELLQQLGSIATQHNLTIAIEPINKLESNIINLAAEGLRLAREVSHPNIQLLVDFYHLMMEHEDPAIIMEAGPAICHLHFAKVEGRVFPAERDPAYARFFEAMRSIQYSGRCSIEAYTHDFPTDARRAIRILRC